MGRRHAGKREKGGFGKSQIPKRKVVDELKGKKG